MIKTTTRSWKALGILPVLLGLLLLSGCADALVDGAAPAPKTPVSVTLKESKLRHAHLMDRAVKQVAGKSMSGGQLNLIVKLADGVIDKQRVLERYRVLDRYRVLERYEYKTVFNLQEETTGFGLLQALRKMPKHEATPAVACMAYATPYNIDSYHEGGSMAV